MTFIVPPNLRWVVLGDTAETFALVDAAARENGYRSESVDSELLVDVPRSLLRRRPAVRLRGTVGPSDWGTEIAWDRGPDARLTYEHLVALEASIPAGSIYYYGMVEVAAAAGVVFQSRWAFQTVAARLRPDERVRAVGRGVIEGDICLTVLTDRRLLVLGRRPGSPPYLNARLETLETVKLGKKSSGETLRIGAPSLDILVSQLGHGEGHAIAVGFRLRAEELGRSSPVAATEVSVDAPGLSRSQPGTWSAGDEPTP